MCIRIVLPIQRSDFGSFRTVAYKNRRMIGHTDPAVPMTPLSQDPQTNLVALSV